jgi:hypothetical protein
MARVGLRFENDHVRVVHAVSKRKARAIVSDMKQKGIPLPKGPEMSRISEISQGSSGSQAHLPELENAIAGYGDKCVHFLWSVLLAGIQRFQRLMIAGLVGRWT